MAGRVIKLAGESQSKKAIKVVVQGAELDEPRVTYTDDEDEFRIDNLPPGEDYQVTFYKEGHHEISKHGVYIQAGQVTTMDISLGRWHQARNASGQDLTDEQKQDIERLKSVGYLSGSQQASARQNVTVFDSVLAGNGLNLYTSGHEACAFLIDMEGRVLHEWSFDRYIKWPHREISLNERPGFWRRVYAYPNGDLLAVYSGLGIIKLDKDSDLLWFNANGAHHDLDVAEDGTIYVLARDARVNPDIHPDKPVLEDFIALLAPGGETIKEISVYDAFKNSSYRHMLSRMNPHSDIFHTNSIEVFDGKLAHISPFYKKGNVLISSRVMDNIAIVDLNEEKVVWATLGDWKKQHEPCLLENGNMLLFDNLDTEISSKVIEFDPATGDILWTYRGTPPESFFTVDCGSNQRLPNGNTLIIESNYGRAFEVTATGNIVWGVLQSASCW
ncbi:MAG: arylsulfotransferase family protein [Candidatus Latescibacterota bacterium]